MTTTRVRQRRRRKAEDQATEVHAEALWTDQDKAELAALEEANDRLPKSAKRGVIAIRLSVFRDRDDDVTAPVRNELDCRRKMLEDGVRLVGVARDLNVSATKVPPWERKALGDWLNNRTPEYDVIYFWKLDRFVRSFNDMTRMVSWCSDYHKNLVSIKDNLDLDSPLGKMFVAVLAAIAEVEALNTSARVSSMWDHARKQAEWLTGPPPFGYTTTVGDDGVRRLIINEAEATLLKRMGGMILAGVPMTQVAKVITQEFALTNALHTSDVARRLRNPAITGKRVVQTKRRTAGYDERATLYVHPETGQHVQVGPPIFTEDEFKKIGEALDGRRIARPQSRAKSGGQSPFLDVLLCADCEKNLLELNTKRTLASGQVVVYRRLNCRGCKPQVVVPSDEVYAQLVNDVLTVMGHLDVVERRYTKGDDIRARMEELQETYTYYASGLAPGGWATGSAFTKRDAEMNRDRAAAELAKIDPADADDHWENVPTGKTFRQHWEEGGMAAMAEDLRRIGALALVTRRRPSRQRGNEPEVTMKVRIPKDYAERLPMKTDVFSASL